MKRTARDSGAWQRAEDGTWQPLAPPPHNAQATIERRQSHDHLHKRNRLKDPHVIEHLQCAVRKVMMVEAFRNTLKNEIGVERCWGRRRSSLSNPLEGVICHCKAWV